MKIEVELRFSDISEFGYVPVKMQEGPVGALPQDYLPFGSVAETLHEMAEWLAREDLDLGSTATCSDERGDGLRVFGSKVSESQGDWCLSLVEEVPAGTKGVNIFKLGSPPDEPETTTHAVDRASEVSGFYTHYWFLPEAKLVASVRINKTAWPSMEKMRDYVRGFMARYSPRLVTSGGSIYVRTPRGIPMACRTVLRSAVSRGPSREALVLGGKVNKVILRETVTTYLPPVEPGVSKVPYTTSVLRIFASGALPASRQGMEASPRLHAIESRVEATFARKPTQSQVKQMIDGWNAAQDDWSNLGFEVVRGRTTKTVWLRKAMKTTGLTMDVQVDPVSGIVDTGSLAAQLANARQSILDSIRGDSGNEEDDAGEKSDE